MARACPPAQARTIPVLVPFRRQGLNPALQISPKLPDAATAQAKGCRQMGAGLPAISIIGSKDFGEAGCAGGGGGLMRSW